MYIDDPNRLSFRTSFIDHPFKKLDKSKAIRHSFIVKKMNEYVSKRNRNNLTAIWYQICVIFADDL